MDPEKHARQIIEICKLMHQRQYIAAWDGNVSVKLNPQRVMITPSGFNKGFITADDLIVTDMSGKAVRGERRPSSEVFLHLKVYEQRPDVAAVVHAHPPTAVALTIAGVSMAEPVLPEVVLLLGGIPTAEYATPSTLEGPEALADPIAEHDAVMLERHGSVTVGRDLIEAYNRLEKLEHTAKVILAALQAGGCREMDADQIKRLEQVK